MNKWDKNFIELAAKMADFSKDPSTKVGAVITDNDNRIISQGYNGFPRGIKDDDRLHQRDLKYRMIIHAETNAILFARKPLDGCTIYTWPFMPCSNCTSLIIQSGIKRVVSVPNSTERWVENFELACSMFKEANVKLEIILDTIKYY